MLRRPIYEIKVNQWEGSGGFKVINVEGFIFSDMRGQDYSKISKVDCKPNSSDPRLDSSTMFGWVA